MITLFETAKDQKTVHPTENMSCICFSHLFDQNKSLRYILATDEKNHVNLGIK